METQKNKNSVFAGIFPPGEPVSPPVPAPPAHQPDAAGEQVAALNKKIELMERNIVGQLEKKLSEQVPPPPPPPSVAPAVLLKMTEMADRLQDFQEKFLLGAAQTKNSEESKISGRREIEELLKAVREQQKYSELDRQMHVQLEKAWSRVEEMEKRMMEVYAAAAKKPPDAAPAVSPEEIAAAVLKAVDAGLEERLAPLEAALRSAALAAKKPAEPVVPAATPAEISVAVLRAVEARLEERLAPVEAALKNAVVKVEAALKNAVAKVEASPAAVREIEGRVTELSAAVDARLTGCSSEIRQLRIDNFAGTERMGDILAEVKKDVISCVREAFSDGGRIENILVEAKKSVISSVRESFAEGNCAFLRHTDAAAVEGRERIDALGKLIVSHMDELATRSRDNALKTEALGSCVIAENQKVLSAVSSVEYGLEKAVRAHIDEAAARALAENIRQFEKIKEAYGLSASYAPAIAAVAGNISEIEGRLGGVLAGLKTFIKALAPVNLEAVLGVSGAIIRRSFESAGELAAGLEKETVLLAKRKGEIEMSLKSLSFKPGGEKK